MQNLDWNKCFQRVSDAGLHFPLLFPSSGWHVFVFPLVRPPRTTGEACPPPLCSPASCTSLKWMRADINIKYEGKRKKSPHIRLDSRFAFNAFYMWEETKKEPRYQPEGVNSGRKSPKSPLTQREYQTLKLFNVTPKREK